MRRDEPDPHLITVCRTACLSLLVHWMKEQRREGKKISLHFSCSAHAVTFFSIASVCKMISRSGMRGTTWKSWQWVYQQRSDDERIFFCRHNDAFLSFSPLTHPLIPLSSSYIFLISGTRLIHLPLYFSLLTPSLWSKYMIRWTHFYLPHLLHCSLFHKHRQSNDFPSAPFLDDSSAGFSLTTPSYHHSKKLGTQFWSAGTGCEWNDYAALMSMLLTAPDSWERRKDRK